MQEKFSVSFITFSDGERYPLLLNHERQPHWYTTLYATTQIRNASKAPNTIAAVLAAIRILLSWSLAQGQDLEYRFSQRNFLNEQELESIRCYTQITEFGFCIHDFTMSPCQRFRDCLNCTEQVCIKGDRRIDRIKERYRIVKELRDKAAQEINAGTAGADRWYQIHDLTEKRLQELIGIMENPTIQNGAIVKLRNENEFSPLRRAIDSKTEKIPLADQNQRLLEDVKNILGGGLG